MVLTISDLSKSFGADLVFSGLSASIQQGDRIGLIGINGAGKSTLLNIIYGDLDADTGEIALGSGMRAGFFRQNSGLNEQNTIEQEMRDAYADLLQTQQEMRRLEHEIAETDPTSPAYPQKTAQYNALQDHFDARRGYQIDVQIATILNGMGFGEMPRHTPVAVLSGGERTRLAICKLLLEEPDLLILDEPTNHLDFQMLTWLEEYLLAYKGAMLLVSHDRYFLNRLCTAVWELEDHRLSTYKGNYSRFLVQKEERIARQWKEYEIQQEEIAHLKDYVARNQVRATTASRAKSKQKAIDRMELVERPKPPPKSAKIRFRTRNEPVKDVLQVQGMSLCVGSGAEQKQLFSDLDFALRKGDKVALIGQNGVGKSSFLKAVQGLIELTGGAVQWGHGVEVSYFEQGAENMELHKTALNELWDRFPRENEQKIRTVLGQLRLTGENVYKQVGQLSGGERAKLKFARLVLSCGNVLIMDEPTNHLDLATKEVLDTTLQEYDGTLLVVSHDRYLLNKFPDRIVEMAPDGMTTYKGNYDAYIAQKERKATITAPPPAAEEKPLPSASPAGERSGNYRSKKDRAAAVARKQRTKALEHLIEQLEVQIFELENQINLPEIARDYLRTQEKCAELDALRLDLDCAMNEWAALEESPEP